MLRVLVVLFLPAFAAPSVRAEEPQPIPETFPFCMKDAKWDVVFAEYAKTTGMKAQALAALPGTFTFAPTDPNERLTVGQITDVINDALRSQKHILIRRRMTFMVVSTAEKIDWNIVARIDSSELAERGSTELVRFLIPLEGIVAADIVDDLKKSLPGLSGEMTTHKQLLIVSDTAFNARRVKRLVETLSEPRPDGN